MTNKNWNLIRIANEKYLRIPPEVSDYIAIQDILRLCTYGLDNKSIARRLNVSFGYVRDTLMHFLEFRGWEQDLDFNPYFIYDRNKKSFKEFSHEIELITRRTQPFDFLLSSFFICKLYDEINTKVSNYYDKEGNRTNE